MTRVAVRARVDIAGPAAVFFVHLCLAVARQAVEHGVCGRIGVAGRAGSPLLRMRAGVDREIPPVVIEGRACPRRRRVARGAIGWESGRGVVRIRRRVVVREMARDARRRLAAIDAVAMAPGTRRGGVRARERESRH